MAGLSFDIFAKDRASDVFDKVGKKAEESGSRMSKVWGNVGKVFAGGLAVAGITGVAAAFSDAVGAAQRYQSLAKATAAVLKSTGNAAGTSVPHVQALAGELESMSGVDEELIINSQNVMATFTGIRNEVGKGNDIFDQATKTALNMSVALGTDLQGSTIQLGKALNDPIKGITALQRVGVSFTQQQRDQIAAMVKAGDTMGAQKLILAELNKEFGGAAEAAGQGFQGALARAQDAVGDLMRDLATMLLPVLTSLANFLTTTVVPAFRSIFKWMQQNSGVVKVAAIALGALLGVWMAYSGAMKTVAVVQALVNSVMAANPIGIVVVALTALVAGVVIAYNHFDTFRNIVNTVWSWLGKVASVLSDVLSPVLSAVSTIIGTVVVPVLKFLLKAFMTVVGAIINGAADMFGWVPGIGPKLQGAAAKFNQFQKDANDALAGIDRDVNVRVSFSLNAGSYSNVMQARNNIAAMSRIDGARAAGGPVSAGRSYLVGEHGPEVFKPSQPGSIEHGGGGPMRLHPDDIRGIGREAARAMLIGIRQGS